MRQGLRRMISLLLVTLLLLNGCTESKKTYFQEVWREDVKFSEIKYEHYDRAPFDLCLKKIYQIAENGGTRDGFTEADYNLWVELEYVYTLTQLAELELMADPADETLAGEYQYIMELYLDLYDEYWLAMHTMAVSENRKLMTGAYHGSYIDWFEEYVPYSDEENELLGYDKENLLIREYYALLEEDTPDEARIGEIYCELIGLRNQQAEMFGCESYAEYAYSAFYGRDYLPQDAVTIWDGVKEYFVPLYQKYRDEANAQIERLTGADNLDCSPEAIIDVLGSVIDDVSPEMNRAFIYMKEHELYDIEADASKSETGYTVRLYSYNLPYIFNAASLEFYDYMDMIHEFGHFVNSFYTESDFMFGICDMDICELQSQGLEVIMTHYYGEIFGEEYENAARYYLLMSKIGSLIDGALFDEFQQTVYAQEELTAEKISEIYSQLYVEYGYEPYDGYEKEWMWVNHNFETPFYYISYGVSALGALELYALSCESLKDGIDRYLTVCAADSEMYYYSELLEMVGMADVFDSAGYPALTEMLEACFASGADRK